MKRLLLTVLFCMGVSQVALASEHDFQEGKDFVAIKQLNNDQETPSKTIKVTEFFSYFCPWCYHIQNDLHAWLKTKSDSVTFRQIPVIYQKEWRNISKAHYAAVALGVEDKIVPALFEAIQVKGQDVSSVEALTKLFEANGVSKDDFENAFNFSPSIELKIKQSEALTLQYKITEIPTIVVSGKYKVNPSMTRGDSKKMFAVVDFLIEKSKKEHQNNS